MRPRLLLEAEAKADLLSAFQWYETQRSGLGSEFLAEVARVFEMIEANPEQFPVIRGRTRRGLVRRFPYGIFFVIDPDLIAVTACMHGRRDPERWSTRR